MKVLGSIKEVNEFDLVVSLPNGLHGFVHITHINEKITEKLHEEMNAGDNNDDEVQHELIDRLNFSLFLCWNERNHPIPCQ